MMSRKALIIDDSRGDFQLIKIYLLGVGWKDEILWASSGEEGLEIVRLEKPQVVFLDINMPGLDGFDVCKELKLINKSIHIIMLSATKDPNASIKAKECGAHGFCHKTGGSVFETLKYYYESTKSN